MPKYLFVLISFSVISCMNPGHRMLMHENQKDQPIQADQEGKSSIDSADNSKFEGDLSEEDFDPRLSKAQRLSENQIDNLKATIPGSYFDWPVDQARLTRGYFLKPSRGKSKRPHLGIDLAAPKGTSIYAAHDGVVIYVGREFKGYGRMIMLEGKYGWATLYAHLTRARVKQGMHVRQGDLIGDMGRTGRATGVHLHFEIRKLSGPVNPMKFLPSAPRFAGAPTVLLPDSDRLDARTADTKSL